MIPRIHAQAQYIEIFAAVLNLVRGGQFETAMRLALTAAKHYERFKGFAVRDYGYIPDLARLEVDGYPKLSIKISEGRKDAEHYDHPEREY